MNLLRRADPPSAPANVSVDLSDTESMPPPAPRPRAEPGPLGSARDPSLELWATKHAPTSEATIVVAKKKLDVLREWFAGWDAPRRLSTTPRVLLVVGPPGSGKSAAIRLVAREFRRGVHEWRAPVPTLWEEHKHAHGGADWGTNASAAPAYSSKLDDFAAFVQRASRYAPLAVRSVARSSAPLPATASTTNRGLGETTDHERGTERDKQPVLLVEDLPVGGGEDQHRRALNLLARLARESRVPAVVAVSEEDAGGVGGLGSNPAGGGGGGGGGGGAGGSNRKTPGTGLTARSIAAAMEAAGAATVAFNPATAPKLVKALAAVAAAERVDVDDAGLAAIAAAAEGDVRCALASLQMFAAGRSGTEGGRARAEERGRPRSRKRKAPAAAPRGGDDAASNPDPPDAAAADGARRDRGLSVFHALGKILYNKRDLLTAREDEADAKTTHENGSLPVRPVPTSPAARRADRADPRGSGPSPGPGPGPEDDADPATASARRSAPFSSGKPARGADGALWFGSAVPAFPLHATFARGRTKYVTPETILARARFSADRAAAFLFENFAEGLRDDAAEDAAAGAAYLSDAAWFASAGRSLAIAGFGFGLGSSGVGSADGNAHALADGDGAPADPGAVGELAAGSVATRGLLFAPHPSRPSLRGFRAFKGPQSAKAHRAAVANLREVRAVVAAAAGGDFSVGSDRAAAAAETLPMLRVIAGAGAEGAARVPYLPARWVRVGEDPATAGGVGGLPPGARCAPRPGEPGWGGADPHVVDRAAASGDEDEDEAEEIEDADDF